MEETVRGVVESVVVSSNNPRCQINLTIQPFDNNFSLTPLINCAILGIDRFRMNLLNLFCSPT